MPTGVSTGSLPLSTRTSTPPGTGATTLRHRHSPGWPCRATSRRLTCGWPASAPSCGRPATAAHTPGSMFPFSTSAGRSSSGTALPRFRGCMSWVTGSSTTEVSTVYPAWAATPPRSPTTSSPDDSAGQPVYDVVVVGARAAGAATALLLARAGLRVLLVDRGQYGSDTMSTHALMRGGVLQLTRWGLLDAVIAA